MLKYLLILQLTISISIFSQGIDSTKISVEKEFKLENEKSFEMRKNPTYAMLQSAILPGLGQYYNESYWKIPIIWGTSAVFISSWVLNNKEYWKYAELYSSTGISSNYELREFYRDQRDMYALFMGITYLLNIVDAYVDAHLFDFVYVSTNKLTKSNSINLRLKL